MADSQNYGDDVTARELINPPAFAELNVPEGSTDSPRSLASLCAFFAKIGYKLDPIVSEVLFEEASPNGRFATINDFRRGLNNYLEAVDTDNEREWRRERGI